MHSPHVQGFSPPVQQPSPQSGWQSMSQLQSLSPGPQTPSPQPVHIPVAMSHVWPGGHAQSEGQSKQFSPGSQNIFMLHG
jgi:hypothetical protein